MTNEERALALVEHLKTRPALVKWADYKRCKDLLDTLDWSIEKLAEAEDEL